MKRMDVDLDSAWQKGAPIPEPPRRQHSQRSTRLANELWRKFTRYYGARFSEQFGPKPSDEWVEALEGVGDDHFERALRLTREKHVIHPPTLPMFEAVVREARQAPRVAHGPSMIDRLTEAALKRGMTDSQRIARWTYMRGRDGNIVGLTVPAIGDEPEIRVLASQLPQEVPAP